MAVDFDDNPNMTVRELQAELKRVVDQINSDRVKVVISPVRILTTSTPVAHGLGFRPLGAVLVPHSTVKWRTSETPDHLNVYFSSEIDIDADVIVFP